MDAAPGWVPLLISRPVLTARLRRDALVARPLERTLARACSEHLFCTNNLLHLQEQLCSEHAIILEVIN
jgi:hypothetical protein